MSELTDKAAMEKAWIACLLAVVHSDSITRKAFEAGVRAYLAARHPVEAGEVVALLDTLDSCLETFWCMTGEGTVDRQLAEGAQHASKQLRARATESGK